MSFSNTIIIGCDHAAVDLKTSIIEYFIKENIQFDNIGTDDKNVSVHYPDYGIKVAKSVASGEHERGILICGTGIGMSMVANRFSGVRAALCNDLFSAQMCRKHNNANLLVMGGRLIGDVLATAIVQTFLETPFEGNRHAERLAMFETLGELL